jgi:peptidoglycan/xylan/chitin deacetylase (PgdA/CDA1 family)
MLNLRNTNIVLGISAAVLAWLHFRYGVSPYWLIPLLIAYSLVLFYGSYYIGSNFYIRVICAEPGAPAAKQMAAKQLTAKQPAVKQIALTFDDGPAGEHTAGILQVLKEQGVEAAFFCIGQRIPGREALLRQAHEEGHVIGNHSYSHHLWFDLFSAGRMTADLGEADKAIQGAIGLKPRFFRPPYGVTNPNLARAIGRGGYIPIGWNIRSLDTVNKDETKLLRRVTGALKPGAIILFHDTSKATLSILPEVIRRARAGGYVFARLDKMVNIAPYA